MNETQKKTRNLMQQIFDAGFHGDQAQGETLYFGSLISRAVFNEAYQDGQAARQAGNACKCPACNGETTEVLQLVLPHVAGNKKEAQPWS